jgi:RNA polymerase sigma-70 factor (ECF subfamily)
MSTSRLGAPSSINVALGVRVRGGSEAAVNRLQTQLGEMYDALRVPVVRYLICFGLRREEADEIVQETFLRAYKQLRGDGSDLNLRGWVFRVAHNLAVNHHKRQRSFSGYIDTDADDTSAAVTDPSPNAEEVLLQKESLHRITVAMRTLSAQEMECIHLRAEGLRYREIAQILGIGISTVADSLRRALAKLSGERDA